MRRVPFIPQEHQLEMGEHVLAHPRCGVWAPMGSGKTAEMLTVLHALELVEPGRSLAIAPRAVARNVWPYEAMKWEHLHDMSVVPIMGTPAERERLLRMDVSTFTINYDLLPWLIEWHLVNKKTWRWSRVVADESTRLKNFRLKGQGGARAQAISRVAHKNVKRWINLTGSPSPNGLRDLWGQTWFLDEGARLGRTLRAFEERWFRWQRRPSATGPNHEIKQIPEPYAMDQIQAALSDICLTPTMPFSVDVPVVRPRFVELPAKARYQYNEMEKNMFAEIGDHEIEAFNAATKTMKCLQMASGIAWVDAAAGTFAEVHDEKLQELESIVEEAAGMPVLVRYHWVPSLKRILAAFKRAVKFDGSARMIAEWNEGRYPIMLVHAQSAGHGLNLQDGGNILASYDHWWDLEQAEQVIERIGPMRQKQAGHNRPVFHYPIIARDTVDELVIARIESKRTIQDVLREAMKRRR